MDYVKKILGFNFNYPGVLSSTQPGQPTDPLQDKVGHFDISNLMVGSESPFHTQDQP